MGNCKSASVATQKCKGCTGDGCDCTAGFDKICGRCDPSWKYNIPGTYDATYNAWVKNNPEPVKPRFDPQPSLESMDFVCTQCSQCQDFSGIKAGGNFAIDDPSQIMQCIGKMEEHQIEEGRAVTEAMMKEIEKAREETEEAARLAARAERDARLMAEGTDPEEEDSGSFTLILVMFFVMFIIVIIAFTALARRSFGPASR